MKWGAPNIAVERFVVGLADYLLERLLDGEVREFSIERSTPSTTRVMVTLYGSSPNERFFRNGPASK